MSEKQKCTPEAPLCTACREAFGKKRRIVFFTDDDPEAERLRKEAEPYVRRLRTLRI